MSPWLALGLGVLVVLGITALTGYFVAQEFAYMAVDRSRLAGRAAQGDEAAERTLAITRRTSFMLSGAQLGITVTGLLVGYVAEPLIGNSLARIIGGEVPAGAIVVAGGIVALTFSTLVQMLFGELFPKNYAIARADGVARALTPSTRLYLLIFGPLIWVFDRAAEAFLRLLRIEPVHDVDQATTAADLERVVEASRASGDLPTELSHVLERILDFPQRDVGHAMVGRVRTDVIRDDATVAEARARMAEGHTRYPVLDDDEHIVGVVDLVGVLKAPDGAAPVTTITAEPLVLAEAMALPDALHLMQGSGDQLACVVDEFGSFVGVLTLEDLAEEVVGDIIDEHDDGEPALVVADADGAGWRVPGDLPLDEVERALDVHLPEGDYETIAGLVIDEFGRLPAPGDAVTVALPAGALADEDAPPPPVLRAEVVRVENHVPAEVHLSLEEQP